MLILDSRCSIQETNWMYVVISQYSHRSLCSHDDGWFLAENGLGQRGLIPGNYVQVSALFPIASEYDCHHPSFASNLFYNCFSNGWSKVFTTSVLFHTNYRK